MLAEWTAHKVRVSQPVFGARCLAYEKMSAIHRPLSRPRDHLAHRFFVVITLHAPMLQQRILQRVLILFLAVLGAVSCSQAQLREKVVCMSSCIGYSTEVDTWQVYERFLAKIVVRSVFFAGPQLLQQLRGLRYNRSL